MDRFRSRFIRTRFARTLFALFLGWATLGAAAEEPTLDPELVLPHGLGEGWYAQIETDKGPIVALLHPEQAPQSVAHFAALADGRLEWTDADGEVRKTHYYDGVQVHKAVAGRRFELGDRTGTGSGAPMLYVPPEEGWGPIDFSQGGRLGMTRSSGRRISAVQFFVTVSGQPWLNRKHPCFGSIVSGQGNAFNISQVKTYSNGRPIEPVMIHKIRIFKIGDPAPLPEPKPFQPRPLQLELRDQLKE